MNDTLKVALQEAWKESEKSPCLKKKVGAVLINPQGEIIGRGYGGPVAPCGTCVRKIYEWQQDGCWSIHAEIRALLDYFSITYATTVDPLIGRKGLENCAMVTTHGPCDQCLKYMNLFGVKIAFYDVAYHNNYSKWDGKVFVAKIGKETKDDSKLS